MKNKKQFIALAVALSAVLHITFYLVTLYEYPFIFTEPIWWIRIPEIFMGFFAINMLIKMMWKEYIE